MEKQQIFADQTGRISSLAFGPTGDLYGCKNGKQIVRFDTDGKEYVLINELKCHSLTTLPQGFYINDQSTPAILWCSYDGAIKPALTLADAISAMAPTADQAFMHLLTATSQSTGNARIAADFSLEHRQQYGFLHLPYFGGASGASGVVVDSEGRSFMSTAAGIQVLDQLGRVNLIIASPPTGVVNGLAFGGTRRDNLCHDRR